MIHVIGYCYLPTTKKCLFGQVSTCQALPHVQVVIHCRYSVAQTCTWEDAHALLFMHAILDDVMSQNELTKVYS